MTAGSQEVYGDLQEKIEKLYGGETVTIHDRVNGDIIEVKIRLCTQQEIDKTKE